MTEKIKKVVLAYSGGLDTSVILKWLIETYQCEVVTFSADIGQEDDFDQIRENARKTGASKIYIEDLKEEFVREYVFPAFRANAIYEGQYLLGTSLARPLIAKRQVEIAKLEEADAVSHGATGKGNDQVRFELGYLAHEPHIKIVAPWREWDLTSRTALMAFARKHGIKVPTTHEKPYSTDSNLLHISYEGGVLEDPWAAAPEDIYTLTVSPRNAPDTPEDIEVGFQAGDPVAVNGSQAFAGGLAGGAQPPGRAAWHRTGRHRGEPLCRHEVQRGLRNAGRYRSADGPHGDGIDYAGSRGDAPARRAYSEVCRADLQRVLVCA